MVIRVFVYGSLKPGEVNYKRYCQGRVTSEEEAIARGDLYDFPHLGYPAMTGGSSLVYGYVLSFDDPTLLQSLDWLEEYDPHRPVEENEYYREIIEVEGCDRQPLGQAWCYLMHPDKILTLRGVQVASGKWASRQAFFPDAV
ncbi:MULTISPECIES: gamma-glutamylcyclotransferase family protein [unclassified Leptolyngbya]|uniref:gamma-glutamylcyclotransferase family protein n=1 Tax=unclassified Leptolyngbya TaxID=2650499 RepID=UPI001684ED0C|nr:MULTISPECIES: gamma-glutamylcyclotransferase family protein [unclassified Leptolyngbya]MBD1913873.1 gamma-glutamylcyclotransferase [Leptolyngbya sp. FACHB-8]MBD2157383.1 gamma-glutamylcyclotransferase [Leptolyngbya sp. FACHB-16]